MIHNSERNGPDDALLPWYARPSVDLQHLLPHHLLSYLVHKLALARLDSIKDLLIRQVIKAYQVDMTQAMEPDPTNYACFNDFFTRQLRPDARPQDGAADAVLIPVDGTISQIGAIRNGKMIQAKGRDYSLLDLLGGDEEWRSRFAEGNFATLFMALGDTHRVNMPMDGELVRMRHVPGRLFEISPSTTRLIPRLLVRNERVICFFETKAGPMAVILVGSMFAGSIATTWAGTITPVSRRVGSWDYATQQGPVRLVKGAELGRFNLGSSVIILFGTGRVAWEPSLHSGSITRTGMRLARLKT